MNDGTRSRLWILAVAALFVGGCAAGDTAGDAPDKGDSADEDEKSKSGEDDDDSSSAQGEDDVVSGSPSSSSSADADREEPTTPPSSEKEPTPPQTDPPPASSGPQNGMCNSSKSGNTSLTKISWTVSGDAVTVTSFSVLVTNAAKRSKNDVSVYITPPGGSEKKAFASGDILTNNAEIPVAWPASASVTPGSKVRIETNFDSSFLDPKSSCTVTM